MTSLPKQCLHTIGPYNPTIRDVMPRCALLIGAYGGEHVGDAAILGGVLLRVARRERIRKADAAVTMRLHASIFARSQRVPTVGIDYFIGGRGKVGELFDDLGAGDRAVGIAKLDPE